MPNTSLQRIGFAAAELQHQSSPLEPGVKALPQTRLGFACGDSSVRSEPVASFIGWATHPWAQEPASAKPRQTALTVCAWL